ncbi:hypothetical protein L2E82_52680 [Cichorium intybus]|nr:hypothetical protein L1887_45826 [Cichorium endivia]KAI3674034.1 hypothetical protein L2E82_52680 [Cichorium intybus]
MIFSRALPLPMGFEDKNPLLAHKLTTQIDSFFERTVQGKSNPLAHYWLILRPAPPLLPSTKWILRSCS